MTAADFRRIALSFDGATPDCAPIPVHASSANGSTILCLTDRGKNGQWIDARAVDPDSPVEMRTCHAPCRANSSDRLPLGSQLALMNVHH